MKRAVVVVLAGCALHAMWISPTVHAQRHDMLVTEPDDGARIRAWIELRSAREEGLRPLLGIASMTAGALAAALSVAQLAAPDDVATGYAPAISISTLAAGLVGLINGILIVATPNSASALAQGLDSEPLSEREIGRLEGRMQLDAELSTAWRIGTGIFGGCLIVAGGAGFGAMVGTDRPVDVHLADYLLAGAIGLSGVIALVIALFETSAEADWREYQRGLAPARDRGRHGGLPPAELVVF